MTDLAKPLADLREELRGEGILQQGWVERLLDELERRAKIDARFDRATSDEGWLYLDVSGIIYDERGVIEPRVYRAATVFEGDTVPDEDSLCEGPDRWTAIEAALNAAGAP